MSGALARVAAVLAVALTALSLFGMFRDLRDARYTLETNGSLRRLAALTIRNFPGRELDSPALFWKSIGRDDNPMRDRWGTEYRLSSRMVDGQRELYWSSAGPDRQFGTPDDIAVQVPYPNGPGSLPQSESGEPLVPPPISTDAK